MVLYSYPIYGMNNLDKSGSTLCTRRMRIVICQVCQYDAAPGDYERGGVAA